MPSIEGGGAEKNFFLITNYLKRKSLNIDLITVSKKETSKLNKNIRLITPINNFWERLKKRNFKYFVCCILLFYYCTTNKNFVIFSFQANLYAVLIAKLFRKKIIIRTNASITGWSNSILKKLFYKRISLLADKIIVNSKELKTEYKKHFNIRPLIIYNPLNSNEIIKKSKKKISFKFFLKNTINFINVGRLVDQKDQMTLIKAFHLISLKNKFNYRLLILGSGNNKNKLNYFIKENKLNKNILIKNRVTNPYPFINKSDCVIQTSIFEGLPNVLLEGLVLKKFIISSDCPTGPKEILKNVSNSLLFKTGKIDDLYYKIIQYYKNKKKFKLKKYSLKNFNYKDNLKKYYSLIINL